MTVKIALRTLDKIIILNKDVEYLSAIYGGIVSSAITRINQTT